jgi:FkbM family methyltransferase
MQDKEMSYSQNGEEKIIVDYFKDHKGVVLDIGANDGKTFSNSLRLIEIGWKAVLVEPSNKAFSKLTQLHAGNNNVECVKVAIGKSNMKAILEESGWHLHHKSDIALLSTLVPEEKKKWDKVSFEQQECEVMDYKTFTDLIGYEAFDFISIDAEGLDWEILSQVNLTHVKMVCVEHNGKDIDKFLTYCKTYGMKEIYRSGENLIMAK